MVEILLTEKHSRKSYLVFYIMVAILIILASYLNLTGNQLNPIAIIGITIFIIIGFASTEIYRFSQTYEITDDYLIHKSGVFKRHLKKIDTSGIRGISISQSLWERLLSYGAIDIQYIGQGDKPFSVKNVNNPKLFIEELEKSCKG